MDEVLNAFRHHRNSHRWLLNSEEKRFCAQRLSASSEFAPATSVTAPSPSSGAQRLSASSEFAQLQDSVFNASFIKCSTPFGIIGIRTSDLADIRDAGDLCSTPFGIIGIRTSDSAISETSRICAQRLSASSEFAHGEPEETKNLRRVLNAFRHHRNSHFRGRSDVLALLTVLNAFRHHRNSHAMVARLHSLNTQGAQRLSASSEFALRWSDGSHLSWSCSTPFGIIGIRTVGSDGWRAAVFRAQRLSASSEFAPSLPVSVLLPPNVLNAFRHHRNSHTLKFGGVREDYVQCSTPFGIIGIRTQTLTPNRRAVAGCSTPFGIIGIRTRCGSLEAEAYRYVLNAFRHHRNSHFELTAFVQHDNLCSTPFGIIGIRTTSAQKAQAGLSCAQRLSASSEFAHRAFL